MRNNSAIPFYSEGYIFTCHAAQDLAGKRFVTLAGNQLDDRPTVGYAAGGRPLGVSAYDVVLGGGVTVYRAPSVMPVTAGAALTAGQEVGSDAEGRAVPAGAGTGIGLALADCAEGDDAKIALI